MGQFLRRVTVARRGACIRLMSLMLVVMRLKTMRLLLLAAAYKKV